MLYLGPLFPALCPAFALPMPNFKHKTKDRTLTMPGSIQHDIGITSTLGFDVHLISVSL
jgi:hypothetical protein